MKKKLTVLFVAVVLVAVCILSLNVSATDVYEGVLPFDKELLYGRNALSEMENGDALVAVYDIIFDMVENSKDEVIINTKNSVDDIVLTVEEVNTVFKAHRFDNPQQFWVFKYGYSRYNDNTVYSVVVLYHPELNTDEIKAEFEEKAEAFIRSAGVTDNMSEYDKALILHDAVVDSVTYRSGEIVTNDYNAYGALTSGVAVCEGYAELYQYLLYICGMQAHEIGGNANGPHAWNLVRIDGDYYMTDPTWDDQIPESYGYYCVTTEMLLEEGREFDDAGYKIPECTATKASFFNTTFYNGSFFKTEPSVKSAITQLKYYGFARFCYNGEGTYTADDFLAWINSNVNEIYFGVKYTNLGYGVFGCEFRLYSEGVVLEELPVVANVPRLAAMLYDTAVTVLPDTSIGGAVICPLPEGGKKLGADELRELVNNERIDFTDLKDGAVATGSKMVFEGEVASVAVKGDVDGDGEVTVFDAMIVKKSQSSDNNEDKFTGGRVLEKMAADVDGDGTADSSDTSVMLEAIVGK